jgi:hypothetical protein
MASLSQIRAQVANVVRRAPEARVIGIRTVNGWKGNALISVSDLEFKVVYCASELQIRETLLDAVAASTPVVVVTNLEEGSLGQDVVVRFARRRLHSVEGWTILKDEFQAREIDPSLLRRPWLADFVMDALPAERVDPVPTGVLDAETLWGLVLRKSLGFGSSRPDGQDLLQWSLDASNLSRMGALSADMRSAVREWIESSAGRMAGAVLDCVDSGLGADAFPVGLAFGTVFAEASFPDLQAAAARLERYTGGRSIHADLGRAWADAAKALYDRLSSHGADHQIMAIADRSDHILREVRADSFAWLSDYSRHGFELRLEQFGRALTEALSSESDRVPDDLLATAESVQKHRWSERFPTRASQVDMAVRIVQWLRTGRRPGTEPELQSLEDAGLAYARDGGFVDWARQSLYYGDPVDAVSSAYGQLCEAVAERRQAQNRHFASLFASWMEAGSKTRSTVLIEDVLRTVVAPAAQSAPVLLVVVDGMSYAVYRELLEDIRSTGWVEIAKKGEPQLKPSIAALPSLTEVCRRSLLSGRLMAGTGDDEKQGFAGQKDLLQVSKSGAPPLLFQKSDLTDTGGATLAADLRREIASSKRRVVAAIVNAVDDHLLKGEQVSVPWTLRHIPVLSHLLAAAMESGRLVILTSDHGHVLDRRTTFHPATAGERYRLDDGDVGDGEVRIKGARVVLPPGGSLIAPWSEKIRYGSKRNGYHGGVSPQECVIPLSLLSWPALVPDGFEVVAPYDPDWWIVDGIERPVLRTAPVTPVAPQPLPRYSERGQAELIFVAPSSPGTWIDQLLNSPVFVNQLKQAGRAAPAVDRIRGVLLVLDERGGTVLRQALAQKIGESELRMPGLIAALRRILNVDGYSVLSVDDASGSVVLNKQLLEVQFELSHGEPANG